MQISSEQSKTNIRSFLWHAVFLAFASNFRDVDTIIPSMLIKAGGTAFHLGLLTAIMLGGARLFQLIFVSGISGKIYKKGYLLLGINLRMLSLFALAAIIYFSLSLSGNMIILLIFVLITIFSLSGAFAGLPYNDIFGKSVFQSSRKRFYSVKQIINSIGIFISALIVRDLIKRFDYPDNYAFLLFCAGILLSIASLGFWNLKEVPSRSEKKKSFLEYIKLIPSEIKKSPNLKNYLLIINSLGLGVTILPFMILFAKENFGLSFGMIGNVLLFRTIGMIVASLIFHRIAHKTNYKTLMLFSLVLGSILPIAALFLKDQAMLYQLLFILSGAFVAIYRIADNGILIEISNNENRVMYTGISGAGAILTSIFPLIAGSLIGTVGYTGVFVTVSLIVAGSFFFVRKINCQKNDES